MSAPSLERLIGGGRNEELLADLMGEVQFVEEELNRQVQSRVSTAAAVGRHTLRAGGKRLRPAFVTLGAKATGLAFDRNQTRKVGAAMEMIHMATLMHDDVIDNSSTRRGSPTAAALFGNRASILGGDGLLAKATVLLSQDGDVELIQTVSEAVVEMVEGEIRELETRDDFNLDVESHIEILELKTASFIEACCESGAIVAGADTLTRRALRQYGRGVGLSFQLVDDILDYRGDLAQIGKPVATDFREGQATLPLIYLRETLSGSERAFVQERFGRPSSIDDVRRITGWMEERQVFERCRELARRYLQAALDAAEKLPDPVSRRLLGSVADFVLNRQT